MNFWEIHIRSLNLKQIDSKNVLHLERNSERMRGWLHSHPNILRSLNHDCNQPNVLPAGQSSRFAPTVLDYPRRKCGTKKSSQWGQAHRSMSNRPARAVKPHESSSTRSIKTEKRYTFENWALTSPQPASSPPHQPYHLANRFSKWRQHSYTIYICHM